jgi:predicted MFS family arabinose efflux permease
MTFPPLVGALAAPVLGLLIDENGWRVGCLFLAAITVVGGGVSLLMMDERRTGPAQMPVSAKLTITDLIDCLREPVLLLIVAGIFLVNIPAVIATSQLKLVVMTGGLSSFDATWLASLYAVGVLVGRIVCGLALDRMPAHRVALVALGMPAIGYAALAYSFEPALLATVSVAFIGLAQGAESDLATFLISRHFPMRNYSLFLSLVFAMIIAGYRRRGASAERHPQVRQ